MRTAILVIKEKGKPASLELLDVAKADSSFKEIVNNPGKRKLELVEVWKSDAGITRKKKFGTGSINWPKENRIFSDGMKSVTAAPTSEAPKEVQETDETDPLTQ